MTGIKTTKKRTESINFYATIATFLLSIFTFNGIEVQSLDGAIIDALNNNWKAVLLAAPSILTIILKVVEKVQGKTFNYKDFLKSKNFRTQLITIIISSLLFFDVISIELSVTIATLAHAFNSAIHFKKDGFKPSVIPEDWTPKSL